MPERHETPRRIALLGATGSIGRSTLDVLKSRSGELELHTATAACDVEGIVAIAREHHPEMVALADTAAADRAKAALRGEGIEVRAGDEGIVAAATWPGVHRVVNGVVGAAGLAPTLAALERGIDVALANKESLVIGGELVTATAFRTGATLLPIDSEHCSLFQCLEGRARETIRGVVLTASGGPFRERTLAEIDTLPPSAALRHPTWTMGNRITIDSATLMNKGLEIIEAHWLFGVDPDAIGVVVHPESIVHAIAVLADGSTIAHLSRPDMRLPIEWALSHPGAPSGRFETLDLAALGRLSFERPDRTRFRCLALAERALRAGQTMPAVLNAADEVCVAGYLDGRIRFSEIAAIVEETLDAHVPESADRLDVLMAVDRWAREDAAHRIDQRESEFPCRTS